MKLAMCYHVFDDIVCFNTNFPSSYLYNAVNESSFHIFFTCGPHWRYQLSNKVNFYRPKSEHLLTSIVNSQHPVYWQEHSSCAVVWRITSSSYVVQGHFSNYTAIFKTAGSLTKYVAPRWKSSLQKFYGRHLHNRVRSIFNIRFTDEDCTIFSCEDAKETKNRLFAFSAWR